MSPLIVFLTITAAIIEMSFAGGAETQPAPAIQNFLTISYYNECDGKDASNLTMVTGNSGTCELGTNVNLYTYLIQCQANKQRNVNSLVTLADSLYPAGAYTQIERLFLVSGGPLLGKYVYIKIILIVKAYIKKCSSVLGYSYVASKSAVLLISDRLDMNVLISPTGGYEVFKKGCTTVCKGIRYVV